MRRLLTLAAFLLVISLVPVCAQRGGGAHGASGGSHGGFSGGGHAGFSGGHGGFSGHTGFSGHVSPSPVMGGSHLVAYSGSHSGPAGSSRGGHFRGGDRFRGGDHFRNGDHFHGRDHFRRHHFRFGGRCFGCWGNGFPLYAYGGIDPYWWWDSSSSYDEELARDRALANQINMDNLEEQQSLRERDQDAYSRPRSRPDESQPGADERAKNDPATVLVFRDQHQREIQNYAIVGETLWSFTPQRTEKIPLAQLDIPATVKANEDRGMEFSLPRSSEGQ
jgi:hypothetical protein